MTPSDLQRLLPPAVHARLQGGCVLTIGNFDGVHLGHQRILASAREDARQRGIPTAALTFEPHPVQVFGGVPAERFRLTDSEDRESLLHKHGIDHVITVPFDRDFALLTPSAFLSSLVGDLLCARSVHVGYDFNFGRDRGGNTDTLRAHAAKTAMDATIHEAVLHGGLPISSTRARKALRSADLDEIAALFGRPWTLQGTRQAGAGRGKPMGIPTLNLYPTGILLPPHGVYATLLWLAGNDEPFVAITNIGTRPTFDDSPRISVETLCLTTDPGPVPVGTELELAFLRFIRPEQRFDDPTRLVAQIERDREEALRIHGLDLTA